MNATAKVRNQLANRDNPSGARDDSIAVVVRRAIERQSGAFAQVLPAGVDAARFSRLVLSAVKSTPELVQCFGTPQGEMSVLLAAMQAAAIGLEPNTPLQECWLTPRRHGGTVEAQLSIGYRGWLKLARQSRNVAVVEAHVVHEHDHFAYSYGLHTDLVHEPNDTDPGELTFAYAVVEFTNGRKQFEVVNRHHVEKRRAVSDSWRNEKARPWSPWTKWPEEMWKKTAIRALLPWLDLTTEAAHAMATDERTLDISDEGVIAAALPEGPEEQDQPTEGEGGTSGDPDPAAEPALPLTIPEGSDNQEVAGG